MSKTELIKRVAISVAVLVLFLSFIYSKFEKLNEAKSNLYSYSQSQLDFPTIAAIWQLNSLLLLEKELNSTWALSKNKAELVSLIHESREQSERLLRVWFLLNSNYNSRIRHQSSIDNFKILLKVSSIKDLPEDKDFLRFIKENDLITDEETYALNEFFKEDSEFLLNKKKLKALLEETLKEVDNEEKQNLINKFNILFEFESLNSFRKLLTQFR